MVMTFDVDPANKMPTVAEALDSMQGYLNHLRMKPVEQNRAMLMFEESLVSLLGHADPEQVQRVTVKARRLLGTLTITLTVPGRNFPSLSRSCPLGFPSRRRGGRPGQGDTRADPSVVWKSDQA